MSTEVTATEEKLAIGWMATMVSSLANNKAALGRRYSEWAVSAPTLESAVAAAAMAQDELGHARSTYPVRKALLGESSDEAEADGGNLALLDDEFTDWTDFIAANLVVDGILTTFVVACQDSSIPQMAQRAKKILQEEGSHRVHGEAWARRICASPSGGEMLGERVLADWSEACCWLGPDDDRGAAAAFEAAMLTVGVADQRRSVESWLTSLFADCGVELELAVDGDWSRWDAESRRLRR